MNNLKITDLLDVNIMQQMQDGFSEYTKMASIMADENGVPITNPSRFTRFCAELVRKSKIGCGRCEACDREGAVQTLKSGKASTYHCHAGLVDYAAPIMLEGRFIGSFIGGQVRVSPLDEDKLWEDALELGISPEKYIEAAKEVPLLPREQVDAAASFLFELARIFSEMAYNNYIALETSRSQEQIARSQTNFVMRVSNELRNKISGWMEMTKNASDSQEQMNRALETIQCEGTDALSVIQDTLEYIRISDGKIELMEGRYNIRDMLEELVAGIQENIKDKPIQLNLTVEEDVPAYVLGDSGHLGQVLFKLMQNSVLYSEEGSIDIHVSSSKISYSTWLIFVVRDHGRGMKRDVLEALRRYFSRDLMQGVKGKEAAEMGLSMVGLLVHQMYGFIDVDSEWGKGTTFEIRIPQLDLEGELSDGV